MSYRISVDTGGTFTDVVVRARDGKFVIGKALSTFERAFDGMRNAIGDAASQLGLSAPSLLAETSLLIYGTTRATNAVVTGSVARTALLTTAGFPDVLVLRQGGRANPHDYTESFPQPYIPRRHTFEIPERIGADGKVVIPLDVVRTEGIVRRLAAEAFEAVAVCLLWSVANPEHELRLGSLLDGMLPGVPYTLSHRLLPVVREYRRASATAIDASLKPLMQVHLRDLERDLREAGFRGEILISNLSGGCSNIATLIEKPSYAIGSGPAMAPIAGINYSRIENLGEDVIVCDTGGTTFDVGIVRGGRPVLTREMWLGTRYTGHLLSISAVDIRSVGAGGGSIAWIDDGGLMHVGPMSAGAVPGPACYRRGGTQPTVSDAALVLGYLDPGGLLGGRLRLDTAAARAAVGSIARQIDLSVEQTALRILALATDRMVRAIEDLTVNEGINPRDSTLVAGGGAAGISVIQIARELGCRRVVLPSSAAALSAAGMQFADVVCEETVSLPCLSTCFDAQQVNEMFDDLEARLLVLLGRLSRENAGTYVMERFAEARYLGQIWELDTPVIPRRFNSADDLATYVGTFHDLHERIFAVRDPASPVETMSWRVRLTVSLPKPEVGRAADLPAAVSQPSTTRTCFFADTATEDCPIYNAVDLIPGSTIAGPAIVQEPATTLVIQPDTSVTISHAGHYLLHAL